VKAVILVGGLLLLAVATACGGDVDPEAAATALSTTAAVQPTSAPPSGPVASVEPPAGPPGSEVTVSGRGWPSGLEVVVGVDLPGIDEPYARGAVAADGSFALQFRIETLPGGGDLTIGVLRLRVAAGDTVVRLPYSVQSPRPIFPTSPAG
jgi:hypothetical protein